MILDTDVIIWYMQGNKNARKLIKNHLGFYISVVTYMELVQGMRNKNELLALRKALRIWKTHIIYIDHEISSKAMFYIEQHYLSHSVELADALIAASNRNNANYWQLYTLCVQEYLISVHGLL